jgi:2-desacetyl-2-hydroxyethyl bacteriochlorophyllide A dehydrogenase
MKAVVLRGPGLVELVDEPEPAAPRTTEALVATRRVGLCGTDYHAFAGDQNFFTYPRVLGHELAVEIVEVGSDVRNVRPGDRCAVLPYLVCARCSACRRGRSNCCERLDLLGVTVDGGMRERFVVPADSLYVRPGLDLDALALVETLGIGWHAVWRSDAQPEQFALIVGAGPIGLAVGQALLHRRTRVVMTDISEARLAAAAASLPVEAVAAGEDLSARLRDLGGGELPSLVFDATGNRQSMESSLSLVGYSGSLVLVGHTTGPLTFENPVLHRREITILASRNARAVDWSELLPLVDAGALDTSSWIGRRTTLDRVPEHLGAWGRSAGAVLKAIVDVG